MAHLFVKKKMTFDRFQNQYIEIIADYVYNLTDSYWFTLCSWGRFFQEGGGEIAMHSRNVPGSMRRKDDRRKRERESRK